MDVDSDDLFVVIIGDEDDDVEEKVKIDANDLQQFENVKVKEEVLDETTGVMGIEDIFHAVELHGEYLEVKNILKEEPEDVEYLDDYSSNRADDYEEYVPSPRNFDDEDYNDDAEMLTTRKSYKNVGDKTRKGGRRFTMVKPGDEKSFVNDLRDQYPDLKNDTNLLIEMLAAIMRSVKPPDPPQGVYQELPDNSFECNECYRKTESLAAAGRHYQEYHGPRYLFCYACGVDFRSKTNLYKHEKACSAPDAVVVLRARGLYVGKKGRSRPFLQRVPFISNMARHIKQKTAERPTFSCDKCSATFLSKQALLSHGYLHDGVRPYQCSMCPAAYTSYSALSRHFNHHTDVQFICDHCGRSFKVKTALVAHMDTHQPMKKFRCEECGKGFTQKAGMLLHVHRVHRQLPPPCACPICPKRFRRMSLLKIHMKEEHGMNLMTRKMFFRSLPTMSNDQLEKAKIVFKDEVATCNELFETNGQFTTFIEDTESNEVTSYNSDCNEETMVEVNENTNDSTEEKQVELVNNNNVIEIEVPSINTDYSNEQSNINDTREDTDASDEYYYTEVVVDNAETSQELQTQELQTQVTEVDSQNAVRFSEELVQYIEKTQLEGSAGDVVKVVCIEDGKLVELTARDINNYPDSEHMEQVITDTPIYEQQPNEPQAIYDIQQARKNKSRSKRRDAPTKGPVVDTERTPVPRAIRTVRNKRKDKSMAVQVMRTKTIIKRAGESVVQTTINASPRVNVPAANPPPDARGRRRTTKPVTPPTKTPNHSNLQTVEASRTGISPRKRHLRNTNQDAVPNVDVTIEVIDEPDDVSEVRTPSTVVQQKQSVDTESVIKRLGSGITVTRNVSRESGTSKPVSGNYKGRLRNIRKGPSMPEL